MGGGYVDESEIDIGTDNQDKCQKLPTDESTIEYGEKWIGKQFKIVFRKDPVYCLGIVLKKWIESEGSKNFRNWLISKDRLMVLYNYFSQWIVMAGKRKVRHLLIYRIMIHFIVLM